MSRHSLSGTKLGTNYTFKRHPLLLLNYSTFQDFLGARHWLSCMDKVIKATRLKTDWMSRSWITLAHTTCATTWHRVSPDVAFLWRQSGERFGIYQLLEDCICVRRKQGQWDAIVGNEVQGADITGALGVLVSLNQSTDTSSTVHTYSGALLVVLAYI